MVKVLSGGKDSGLSRFVKSNASQVSMFIALIILGLIMSIASPYFLTWENVSNLLVYISVSGVMAAGLTVAMLLGGLDVSQFALLSLCMMVIGILHKAGQPAYVLILASVAVSAVAGCINAFVITRMKINPIIATIGMQLVYRAGAFLLTNGEHVFIKDPVFKAIGYNSFLGLPILTWVMLGVYGILYYILKYTSFGRKVYAVGGNPTASYLSGISLNKTRFGAYIISATVAGVAAVLLTAQVSMSLPTAGQGREMDGIAMVILGGVSLTGGKGRVIGTLLGVLIISVLANGMTLLSVPAYYQMLIKGMVLILAVYVDSLRGNKYN